MFSQCLFPFSVVVLTCGESVQVAVPQQPRSPTRANGTDGICSCGVNAPLNLRRFLEGTELHCRLRATKRTKKNCLDLTWVSDHMRKKVSARTMEQARATGLWYLLQTVVHKGSGLTTTQAEAMMAEHYDGGYSLSLLIVLIFVYTIYMFSY